MTAVSDVILPNDNHNDEMKLAKDINIKETQPH